MKLKCTTLIFTSLVFLAGCSDSENKAPQQKSPVDTAVKKQAPATPKQEQKPTLAAKQPMPIKKAASQSQEEMGQEELIQEAKKLADALAYEGGNIPKDELEQDIKKILEAVVAEEKSSQKQ